MYFADIPSLVFLLSVAFIIYDFFITLHYVQDKGIMEICKKAW